MNSGCSNYSDAFLLSFAKNKGPRISYAASIGGNSIVPERQEKFKIELSGFSRLSVRESSAVSLISQLTGQEVEHVVDPVFLLKKEQWEKVMVDVKNKKPYIFFYAVHGEVPGMREYVKDMGRVLRMPIVVVNMNLREMKYKNKKMYDAGPRQFLSLLKNAAYVCTNSFHATAFSIIFHKKFWVFTGTSKAEESPRIYSVVSKFGLQNRVVFKDSKKDYEEEIDYDIVENILQPMIEKSRIFLAEALNE